MYGLWEVQERCDLIISRYQKYETAGEAQRTAAIAANQDFDELHSTITEMVSDLEKRADFLIKNSYSGHGRAAKVAVENTKLRQQKQQAVEACVQLRLMITRGKRLTKETIVRRMGALDQLIEQIGKIPDQIRQGREIFHERLTQAEQLDPGHAVYVVAARADWSQPTSESEKFWEDWERARQKQNEKLDLIALGLDKLNDLGTAIGEELERQDAFVQSLEERVDKVRLKLNKNTENIGTASTKVSMGIKLGTVSVLLFVFLILLGAFLVHLT
uniref:Qc-snare syp7-family n=1 Tax=Tetraselmis sp. GSL018 TaxID=582737 RepID=A0A061S3I9_9CHLO|mmetsp:Transcript_14749/g.35123  ORF Transcript_14749/g.35123 Transcript_14749/m.35123 type:complete len:273 (+) Transcript_14749:910-1728(+)|eukprot:CAMPEP_0177607440 /NCGR_PEP_ID=MMETSP0419_2-20121207/17919_1 /TAXON_ID=582737 /ORGANISM="Tetraselmis sp., Strain GSL018" /LENGTH=272 /DNA_ID=CAMNT_0019102023 /DNA_START=846 /DNA_END=1664 /DNA_ORIENTATION=-